MEGLVKPVKAVALLSAILVAGCQNPREAERFFDGLFSPRRSSYPSQRYRGDEYRGYEEPRRHERRGYDEPRRDGYRGRWEEPPREDYRRGSEHHGREHHGREHSDRGYRRD